MMTIREAILSDIRTLYPNRNFTVRDLQKALKWHNTNNLSAHLCTMYNKGEIEKIHVERNPFGTFRNVYRLNRPAKTYTRPKVSLTEVPTKDLLAEINRRVKD